MSRTKIKTRREELRPKEEARKVKRERGNKETREQERRGIEERWKGRQRQKVN